MAIPMLAQYEQECNAKALKDMCVHIVTSIDDTFGQKALDWLREAEVVNVDYPIHSEDLVLMALGIHKN